jgi:hypothetical protein
MGKEKEELRIKKDLIQKESRRILKRKKGRNLRMMMNHMETITKRLEKGMMGIKEMIWHINQLRLMMVL